MRKEKNMEIRNKCSAINTTPALNRDIRYIVIHYTAGTTSKPGTAEGTAEYYKATAKTKNPVSADYTVDDQYAVRYNSDIHNRYTWHCGGSKYATKGGAYYGKCTNANSIGIEVCSSNSTGVMQNANDKSYYFTAAVVNNAVELTKQLMKEYNIPPERVIRHYDVTGKPCPGIIGWNADTGSEKEWEHFKERISDAKTESSDILYIVSCGAYKSKKNAEIRLAEVKKHYPEAIITAKKKG